MEKRGNININTVAVMGLPPMGQSGIWDHPPYIVAWMFPTGLF
jgi:hypothetical protein